jgi:glycosyltransferase involved in cell wall biosynthesis
VQDFYVAAGVPAEKFIVIPNGIGPAPPSNIRRESLLRELSLPPEARLIAAVGRLWPQKRIKDLIWAADLLKVIRDDVHLLVIGEGPLRSQLERFRSQVRIEDKVHFLGHRPDVLSLLPHCEMLWLASGFEGLPNVVMEAMAAGIPPVVSDIPGNRDLVVDGESGYLVPNGDRAAFARAAQRMLENPELAQRLGAAARERMLREFSIAKMVRRYMDLYRRLLG